MTEQPDTGAVLPDAAEEKPRAKARRRVRCPVCGGQGEPVEAGGDVVRCDECRVRFRNPRPSVGETLARRDARFAGALTRNHATAIRDAARTAVEVMRGYHRMTSGKDAPLNAFGKRVLDVGCGLGFRLREFEKYGWTASGVEPGANALPYTQAIVLHVVRADLHALPPGRFDFVLLEDVLEEVADPAKLMAGVRDVLAPRGVAYAGVRAADGEGALGEDRLYGFSDDGLRRLFMSSGFAEPDVRNDEGVLRMWFRRK